MYNRGEMEKKRVVREQMKRDRDEEFGKMLNEMSQAQYSNLGGHRNNVSGISPFGSRVSLQSTTEHSSPSSSCFSYNGFCLSEETDTNDYRWSPNGTPCFNGLCLDSHKPPADVSLSHYKKNVSDELGLCENLFRMNIRDEDKDHHHHTVKPRGLEVDHQDGPGFGYGGRSLHVEKYGSFDGFNTAGFDYRGFNSSPSSGTMSLDDEMNSLFMGFGGEADLKGTNYFQNQHSTDMRCNISPMNFVPENRKEHGRSWMNIGIQSQNPSRIRPYIDDGSRQLVHCEMDNLLYNGSYLNDRNTNAMPNNRVVPQSPLPVIGGASMNGFGYEDSFIIQGKCLNQVINKGRGGDSRHKKNNLNEIARRNLLEKTSKLDTCGYNTGNFENAQSLSGYQSVPLPTKSSSLAEVRGCIYSMAKDQNGCRFLQRVFDEGTYLDVQIIFNEVIGHIVELMMEQFGNYLVQKLLTVCSEEQRMQVLLMVTKEPGQLVRICLNTYGYVRIILVANIKFSS